MAGVNRRDFQSLALVRLAEAKALLTADCPDGAYYLAGYAVECALKACIAKGIRRHDFPDKNSVNASHTHDLNKLITVANLEPARLEEAARNDAFRNNWGFVQQWSEHSRYERFDSKAARDMLDAIGDRRNGVLVWIRRRW